MIPKKCRLLTQAEQDFCSNNCKEMTATEMADHLGVKYAHVHYFIKTYCPGFLQEFTKRKDRSNVSLENSKGFFSPENYLKATQTI